MKVIKFKPKRKKATYSEYLFNQIVKATIDAASIDFENNRGFRLFKQRLKSWLYPSK